MKSRSVAEYGATNCHTCGGIKAAAPAAAVAIYGPIIPEICKRVEQESALDFYLQGEPDATVYELAAGRELESIAGLRKTVDRFFDEVMVMAENEAVRKNRLALLAELLREFTTVADFSEIGANE